MPRRGQVDEKERPAELLDEQSLSAPAPLLVPPGYAPEAVEVFQEALQGVEPPLRQGSPAWDVVRKACRAVSDELGMVLYLRAAGWVKKSVFNERDSDDGVYDVVWDPSPEGFGLDEHRGALQALWQIPDYGRDLEEGSPAWASLLTKSGFDEMRLRSWLRKIGYTTLEMLSRDQVFEGEEDDSATSFWIAPVSS